MRHLFAGSTAALLLIGLALAGCTRQQEPNFSIRSVESDLAQNGVFRSGYSISVSDADHGSLPAAVYASASKKLQVRLDSFPDTKMAEVFLVPTFFGHDLVILSARRLTKEEESTLRNLTNDAVFEAIAERKKVTAGKSAADQGRDTAIPSVPPTGRP